jgi:hypothetical protein
MKRINMVQYRQLVTTPCTVDKKYPLREGKKDSFFKNIQTGPEACECW